jgi:hypothetical protein
VIWHMQAHRWNFPMRRSSMWVCVAWLGPSRNWRRENRWIWNKDGIIIRRGELQKLLRNIFSRPAACIMNLTRSYVGWDRRLSCENPNITVMCRWNTCFGSEGFRLKSGSGDSLSVLISSKEFWPWCITLRITGFWNFCIFRYFRD